MEVEQTTPPVAGEEGEIVEKKVRKPRQKREGRIGSKDDVGEGRAERTGGGLTKEHLMYSMKDKKWISKKKHESGKKLIEDAKLAKDDPNHPLHEKMKPFWEHQFKKKEVKEGEEAPKIIRKRTRKVKTAAEVIQPEAVQPVA